MRQMKLAVLFFFAMVLSYANLFAVESKSFWEDTVRVAVIWNDQTGTEGTLPSWGIQTGDIGRATKDFVRNSMGNIADDRIKVYSGADSRWSSISADINEFRSDFDGKLPSVIAYINAGYIWEESSSDAPYDLLGAAADSGIGIVAIGDDAAFDAKKILPLKGPKTATKTSEKIEPIQYHGYDSNNQVVGGLTWPPMEDAIVWGPDGVWDTPQSGFNNLLIWLDTKENQNLDQGGLLWNVNSDTLRFKSWGKDGRIQADADLWSIDTSILDNYALIGFQSAKSNFEGTTYDIPKKTEDPKAFNAMATLQDSLNRVVLLCYQPQYLQDEGASQQIVYNSLYWASKAKELLKIPDPVADPASGNPKSISSIELKIDDSQGGRIPDSDQYDIWYTLNGNDIDTNDSDCFKYGSTFGIDSYSGTVTLKAKAVSKDTTVWQHSNTVTFTYEYVGGPVLDSAFFHPGKIKDLQNSTFEPDTLRVRFNKEVTNDISSENQPFIFYDSDDNEYRMKLSFIKKDGRWVQFVIEEINGTSDYNIPSDRSDSLNIDIAANVTGTDNTIQDDSSNKKVVLIVNDRDLPKIATPKPDPATGNTQTVTSITLSVDHPTDETLYTIRYTIGGGDVTNSSDEYTGSIDFPSVVTEDVVIKAVAFSENRRIWLDSDTMIVTYDYVAPPKIDTPEPDPASGNTQNVTEVMLSVDNPTDTSLYFIRYEINGDVDDNSPVYDGEISLPELPGEDITITAVAFSKDIQNYRDSDTMHVTYEYIAPPVIDSAIYSMGELIETSATSETEPDTLRIYFDQEVEEIASTSPFLSYDENGAQYQFKLIDLDDEGTTHTYLVESINNKGEGYIPTNLKDSITIDPNAQVQKANSNIVQDGSNNVTVPLIVKAAPARLNVTTLWVDSDINDYDNLKANLSQFSELEGVLVLIDPRAKLQSDVLDEFTISFMVIDMLGNKILSVSSFDSNNSSVETHRVIINGREQFAVLWNGVSDKNRRVGTAAYVAIIKVTDHMDKTVERKAMLPVPKK